MEISPVTRTRPDDVTVVARASSGATVDLPGVHAPTADLRLPPPATLVGATVEVEFSRHASGVPEVKFYDKRSGEIVDQYPIEKVLDTVTELIDLVRRKA